MPYIVQLLGGSFWYKYLLNFTCYTKKSNNRLHTNLGHNRAYSEPKFHRNSDPKFYGELNVKHEESENIAKNKNKICQICKKRFGDNWKLRRHEKTHVKIGEP